ncbi:hypothetical protein DFH06DRAFT_1299327 [Mycena polygramma]|nr:hypothetical protein DFH06DRAFT_1299327 [Mycena polygramma]
MMNVEVLDVSLQPILFGFFSHISFPLLCTCTLPVSSALLPFLCKNPTIRTLYTFSQGAAGSWNSILIPIQPIRMPRLETFSGPDAAVCSLVPGSLVSTVGIFWAKHRVIEISKIFAAVGSSRASVTQLNNLVSSWDLALPVHIAKHTPQIVFLQIRNVTDLLPTPAKLVNYRARYLPWCSRYIIYQDFMCALDDTLRLLPCLATLVVAEGPESAIYRPIDSIVPGLESQFETVERWGEIAPALRRICLSTMFTSWGRVHDNVWFPGIPGADCPETFQCTKWLVKKALASRIPLLPTPYDVLAEHFAGVDEMAILRMAVARDGAVPAFNILWKDGKTVISYPSAAPTEILVAL